MGSAITRLVFLPPTPTYDRTLPGLVLIDGRLPALFLPLPRQDPRLPPPYTILFSHGNAEDLGQIGGWLSVMRDRCRVQILAYEYEGYGIHTGYPSEAKLYRDALDAFLYLVNELRVPPNKIILFGRSLGTGPTVHLAAELFDHPPLPSVGWFSCAGRPLAEDRLPRDGDHCPAGVLLQSPLTSAIGVVSQALAAVLPGDLFVNISKIHRIRCPIFIVHGTVDDVVPFDHGRALACRAPNVWRFLRLEGAGHNNIEESFGVEYLRTLTEFLRHLDRSFVPPPPRFAKPD